MGSETFSDIAILNPPRKITLGATTPFVDMASLPTNGRKISEIGSREYTGGGSKFQNGDTLVARITPCLENGKGAKVFGLAQGEIAQGSTEFIVIAAKDKEYDEDFVYYLSRHPNFRSFAIARMEGTSGRQRVPWQALKEFSLLLPDKSERRSIGNLLSTLDDKIELNQRMNETLEAMAQAIFKSWFVNFDPVKAKAEGRTPEGMDAATAALFPSRLTDTGLPEGWEEKPFSDFIELIGGGTPKTSVPDYWEGSIPWFSVVDAPSDASVFVIDTEKKITQLGLENSSTKILPVGTTIISARGTVGRLAIVGVPMAMNQSCYGIKGKDGLCDYTTYFFVKRLVEELKTRAHGSVFDTITRDTFKAVRSVLPSCKVSQEFDFLVAPIMSRVLNNCKENVVLSKTRDALLPRLISGKLQIYDKDFFLKEAV